MLMLMSLLVKNIATPYIVACRRISIRNCVYSPELENNYTEFQKERILQIINDTDAENLTRYNITKIKLKKIVDWKNKNGKIQSLSDLESIDGFTEKYSKKLCNNILEGPQNVDKTHTRKIKGQVLHPAMPEAIRKVLAKRVSYADILTHLHGSYDHAKSGQKYKQDCKTVLALYVTVNSVCWTLIDRSNYEVLEWRYKPIEYPGSKGTKITDILSIAWHITDQLPTADVYVMKAEATSLRASGSDPTNPKVLGVNLQKAQMIAMIVALVNARSNGFGHSNSKDEEMKNQFQQKVYFLRPTLPFRLYGTLVGNERVSTDQTVEILLQEPREAAEDNSQVFIPEHLKTMFRSQRDLQKDMLGHCLLLAITFMDVCVYMNKQSIDKLIKRGE